MKNGKICCIETFRPELPSINSLAKSIPVDRTVVEAIQESSLNPDLKRCGTLPGCVGCEIVGGRGMPEPETAAAEVKKMADRVALRISMANL